MFLDALIRRNPALLRAAVTLHQRGELPANSYVLDLDAIAANARTLSAEASRLGLRMYAMTKQLGRNPAAIRTLCENGIDAGVAVDMACARALRGAGARVGHLGHLVQVPRSEADEAVALDPEHWTVFSDDKAHDASAAAARATHDLRLLARIHAPGDTFYPGHEGGFHASDVLAVAARLDALPSARFAGVTTFPALIFDDATRTVRPTPNLGTVARAAEQLREAGYEDVQVNAPGTTSVATLATLREHGATQVEPGHAMTGTTPWHAVEDLPELPAMLYLSEVSHHHAGRSYCFGGGLYIDPVFPPYPVTALVGNDPDAIAERRVPATIPPPEAIDYYGQLDVHASAGNTVLFGFRAQAFVTRANVVAIAGIGDTQPHVEGIWGPGGRPRAAAGEDS